MSFSLLYWILMLLWLLFWLWDSAIANRLRPARQHAAAVRAVRAAWLEGVWPADPRVRHGRAVRRSDRPPSISKRSLKKGGEAGDTIRQLLVEALRTAAVPGQALQGRFGHEPTVPGQWSEEDEAIAGANQDRMNKAAFDIAGNVVGSPGTPKGALGAGARNPDPLHGISKIKLPRPAGGDGSTATPTSHRAPSG